MIIKIKQHPTNFVIIDKTSLENARLSWRAKGLLAYLLTKPDNWVVIGSELVNHAKDGRYALLAAFHELRDNGHATLEAVRNDKGQIIGKEWHIHEKPMAVEP
jgi:hypothetical protein